MRDVTENFSLLDEIYAFSSGTAESLPLERDQQLQVHRISMNSPLELLASIPPAFIAGFATQGGLTNFLAFFERVFNLPLAIKVDRERLFAESHAYRAEQLEHELEEHGLEGKLAELERRTDCLRLTPEVAEVIELEEAGVQGLPSRMKAIAKANDIRKARAQLKRELKEGNKSIVDVLLDPPEYVLTAKARISPFKDDWWSLRATAHRVSAPPSSVAVRIFHQLPHPTEVKVDAARRRQKIGGAIAPPGR